MSVGRPAKARSMDVVCGTWMMKDGRGAVAVLCPENAFDPKISSDFNERLGKLQPACPTWKKYKVKIRGKSRKFLVYFL